VRDDAGDHLDGHEADDQNERDEQVAGVGVGSDTVRVIVAVMVMMVIVPVVLVLLVIVMMMLVRHGGCRFRSSHGSGAPPTHFLDPRRNALSGLAAGRHRPRSRLVGT